MAEETLNQENSPAEPLAQQASSLQEPTLNEASELDLLRQKLDELQKQVDTSKDQFLRKAAEFENFKRRTETDFANLVRNANEGLIVALLPILNDFIRSLKAGAENKDYDSFYKGVELIYNKLTKILEVQGLTPFESVGQPFNVEYHDALLQIPKSDVPPHTVIEEVERGYRLNDKVLRHAKVIVSAEPGENSERALNAGEVKA